MATSMGSGPAVLQVSASGSQPSSWISAAAQRHTDAVCSAGIPPVPEAWWLAGLLCLPAGPVPTMPAQRGFPAVPARRPAGLRAVSPAGAGGARPRRLRRSLRWLAASQVMTGLAVLHTAEAHAMLGERRE